MSGNIKVGSYVKMTDRGEDGVGRYTGRVVEYGKTISVEVPGVATLSYPSSDTNVHLRVIKKPRNWKGSLRVQLATANEKKNPKPARVGSKRDLVETLVAANPELSRKEHIDLVVAEIGMTPAGASTYVSGARKLIK